MNLNPLDRPQVPQLYLAEELTGYDIRALGAATTSLRDAPKPLQLACINLERSLCLSDQAEKNAAYNRAQQSLATLATEQTTVGYQASHLFNSLPAFKYRKDKQPNDQALCKKLGIQLGTFALGLANDLDHAGICCEAIAQGICALNGDIAFPTTFREGHDERYYKYNHDIYILMLDQQTGRIYKLPYEIKAFQTGRSSKIPRILMLEVLYTKRRGIYGYDELPPKGDKRLRNLPDNVKREVLAQSAQLIIDLSEGRQVSDPDKLFITSVKKAIKEKINESRASVASTRLHAQ